MIWPLPSLRSVKNFLSVVVAATEMYQGATSAIVEGFGPELPADLEVNMPLLIAWKAPIACTSSK